MTRPLNVAVVNSELPYPPTAGNRIRTLNLLERLAGRHRITFIARRNADPVEAERGIEYLRGRGIEPIVVGGAVRPKSGPAFYARLAANLISRRPYSVTSHDCPALRRAVRQLAAREQVDLWQAESTALAGLFEGLSDPRTVVIAHNVESLIWQRYRETERDAVRRWYIGRQWAKFERFERRAFARAGRVVAVSAEDARLIRDRFGGRRVEVVDNGIDRSRFGGVAPSREPGRILFLGSLSWRPNQDAVDLLLSHILPQVLAVVPSARLSIVGRNPPEALARRVRSMDGVELHGDVPDVRPHLARAAVMVVPLRVGGGSRLKILESLATGLPVVSTRVGAEGLGLDPGRDFIEADTPEAIAGALLDCIADPTPGLEMAARARQFVLDRYDWDRLAGDLERVWLDCVAGPAPAGPQPAAEV